MKFPLFSFLHRRPERTYSPLTTAEIQQLVAPIVERTLLPLGFELQKPLHWVESGSTPIRKVFGLFHFKGCTLDPSWGFSLDYVPHISGSEVKWHRTAKSALLDLCRREAGNQQLIMRHIWGAEQFLAGMPTAITLSTEKAMVLWNSVTSISNLPEAFEETKRHYQAEGRDFYNYVQHPIAYAFTLAKLGEAQKAAAELEQFFCFRWPNAKPAVCDRIRKLFAEVQQ